ncbi:pentapeptide repeat-containing protein [Alkalinema pantanalense CENA528]|uniref:pentapeptide repeat-containing protein n=1 Tax=Alkalinema pantanalense TaxID=1620705 RepID=UPI003D702129
MANREHLAILKQGVKDWNEWRKANPGVKPDLRNADLSMTDLSDADLSDANLHRAILIGANLVASDFRGAELQDAVLIEAKFRTKFSRASFIDASLVGADFHGSDLRDVEFGNAYLFSANLSRCSLRGTDLSYANLNKANLSRADLADSNLTELQALGTDFSNSTLTGACIQDWNINIDTNLNDVTCDYVYLRENQQERRPSDPNRNFAPGEFAALFQKVIETVDLIFADGIDWKAFFQSFQELQAQYADQELSIQAIEKKAAGAFVIRLETPAVDVDKAALESAAKEKYQAQLKLLEVQYRTQLHAKDIEIESYRRESANMIEITKLLASRPINMEANSVSTSQSSSGDTYIKATNYAPHGIASGGTFNDYSQTINNNLDEIGQLIRTLRSQAEQFPQDAKISVEVHLGDLADDLKQPEKRDPNRIKVRLMALLAIAVQLGGAIATATDFSNNVMELGKKFGVELVQP